MTLTCLYNMSERRQHGVCGAPCVLLLVHEVCLRPKIIMCVLGGQASKFRANLYVSYFPYHGNTSFWPEI